MKDTQKPTARPSDAELKALSDSFESQQPWDLLEYALKTYRQRIVLACSFGAEDVALVDMVHRIDPDAPLFYLDTDFLFPETFDVRDRIIARYGLKPAQVIQRKSLLTPEQQAAQHGAMLWASQPDQCKRNNNRPTPERITSSSGLQLDHVLPSANLNAVASGVFWPASFEPGHHLVYDAKLGIAKVVSSDHRLVWIEVALD